MSIVVSVFVLAQAVPSGAVETVLSTPQVTVLAAPAEGAQATDTMVRGATVAAPAVPETSVVPQDVAAPSAAPQTPALQQDAPLSPAPAAEASQPPQTGDESGIIVTARPPAPPQDPLQAINAQTFAVVQSVDKAVVGPVSMAYKRTLPDELRSGLRHFLDNLQEPVVFLNYLLQHKVGKAAETLGRFAVNSTIGVAGVMDVAKNKPFHLPRHPNGFAFTLGYYGVKTGPFMFLPVIGPTTVRDLFGRWVDLLVLPLSVGKPFNQPLYSLSTVTIRALDERAESDERLTKLREDNDDPYAALREQYLQNRQAEIEALQGKRPPIVMP